MLKLLIKSANVLRLDAENHIRRASMIAMENGKITALGTARDDFTPDETIDA